MTITHFMWGFQSHFRSSLTFAAESMLQRLKPGLEPQAFLVGVRTNDDDRFHRACVEPETNHWMKSEDLYDVLDDVPEIVKMYSEASLHHMDARVHENEQNRLFRRGVRDAVLRRLNESTSRPKNLRLFASAATAREGFLVLMVVAVREDVLSEVPAIKDTEVRMHERRKFRIPESLVEAALDELFRAESQELTTPDAGADLLSHLDLDELLRKAGRQFFRGLLKRVDHEGMVYGYAENALRAVSRLSLTPYESVDPIGHLTFLPRNRDHPLGALRLADPVPLSQVRTLRKLLLLARDDMVVRCSASVALSVEPVPSNETAVPNEVRVTILGRGKWLVKSDSRDLMLVVDGYPTLPAPVVDPVALASELRRRVRTLPKQTAERFANIVFGLAGAGHGLMFVLTDEAETEAQRLKNDGLLVSPIGLTLDFALALSRIDGAILCGTDGALYAAGVILDGEVAPNGDRGRGARFNSALRYVTKRKGQCAAIVISEDGGVDLLPKLPAPVSAGKIQSHLSELEQLSDRPAQPVNRERECDVIDWLNQHSYCMTIEQCASANRWIEICEERFKANTSVTVTRSPLSPSQDFDPERDLLP